MWPGPVRRVGLAQVPAGAASTRACSGWASTTSTSSTRTGSTPRRRSRRRWARSTPRSAQGKARYVGISSYGPRRTEEAAQILRELGTPLLIHQPSYSMLNRWIEDGAARRARPRGRRRDRLLAARPGPAHRPLPGRRARGLARAARQLLLRGAAQRGEPRARARAERDRAARAARRWPRWRSPGCCATRASPRRCSAPRASRSSSRTSPRSSSLDFDPAELEEIDRYAVDGGINLWAASSTRRRECRRSGVARPTSVTIWPLLLTYVCAGAVWIIDRERAVRAARRRTGTALALPFRPAATSQATTWRPGSTAVTPQSNLAVWPGASGRAPRCSSRR